MNYFVKINKVPAKGRNEAYHYSAAAAVSGGNSSSPAGSGVSLFSQLGDVLLTAPSAGQFAYYNGEKWVNTSLMEISTTQMTVNVNTTAVNNLDVYGNLSIRGEVNQYNANIINVDDAFIKLNNGNGEVDSGIKIQIDSSGSISQLYRKASDDRWYIDDDQILLGSDILGTILSGFSTGVDSPIAASNDILTAFQNLQGQVNNRPKYNENAKITGDWSFYNGITIGADTNRLDNRDVNIYGGNVNVDNYQGIKFINGFQGENKWVGYYSVSESLYANSLAAVIYANGNEIGRFNSAGLKIIGKIFSGQFTNGTAAIDAHDGVAYYGCNIAENGLVIGSNGLVDTPYGSITKYYGINKVDGTNGYGLSLWNGHNDVGINQSPYYGLFFGQTSTFGQHGYVNGSFATYVTTGGDSVNNKFGWIFRNQSIASNVLSIDNQGNLYANGDINNVGVLLRREGAIELNGNTPYIDFHFGSSTADYTSRIIESISGYLDFQTNATRYTGLLSSISYTSGFAGSGWQLSVGSESHLTIDRLTVRGRMDVYELVVNKIRATNGSLWVNDGMKITAAVKGGYWDCYFDNDNGNNPKTFLPDDIILSQRFTGRGVKRTVLKVVNYGVENPSVFFCEKISGDDPLAGDEYVRIGNTANTDRQGSIYLTSSDSNSPYIDVMDGVNSESFAGKIKVRLGRLNGIVDANYGALTGYGLYAQNVYLTGGINATYGKIGAFTITDKWIKCGTNNYLSETWGAGANGVALGREANVPYPTLVVQWDENNGGGFGNISIGQLLRHGAAWDTDKIGINMFDKGQTLFEVSKNVSTNELIAKIAGFSFSSDQLWGGAKWGAGAGCGLYTGGNYRMFHAYQDTSNYVRVGYGLDDASKWGIEGVLGNNKIFEFGTNNQIAGWSFDSQKLWNGGTIGSISAGIELNASSKYLGINYNASNYIKMHYTSTTDWGINGVVGGNSYFQLGSTNKIAGFTFTENQLSTNVFAINSNANNSFINFYQYDSGAVVQSGIRFNKISTTNSVGIVGGIYCGIGADSQYINITTSTGAGVLIHSASSTNKNQITLNGRVKMHNALLYRVATPTISISTHSLSTDYLGYNLINIKVSVSTSISLPMSANVYDWFGSVDNAIGCVITILFHHDNAYSSGLWNYYNQNGTWINSDNKESFSKGDCASFVFTEDGAWCMISKSN